LATCLKENHAPAWEKLDRAIGTNPSRRPRGTGRWHED
jgi:hypothetical protein